MLSRIGSAGQRISHDPTRALRLAVVAAALLAIALALATRGSAPSSATARSLAGRPAPAFSLATLAGTRTASSPLTLASQRGHPVLLVFTYTLCPHCLPQTQTTAALAAEQRAPGLRVLLVDSPAESPSIVAAYLDRVRDNTAGLTVLLDSGGATARAYAVGLYPTTLLIDSQGIVRDVWTGETNITTLRAALSRLPNQ